jgi:acetylglutamate kinase
MTDTELKLIAVAAIIGESNTPNTGNAIGLTGKGKCLVSAKKLPTPEGVDLGFVGEVDNIDMVLSLNF